MSEHQHLHFRTAALRSGGTTGQKTTLRRAFLAAFLLAALLWLSTCGGSEPAVPGRIVAFEDSQGIASIRPDGSGFHRIAQGMSADDPPFAPAWSPDGTRIAFLDNLGDVYVSDADGSHQTNLTANPAQDGYDGFAWSPDGQTIAFTSNRDGNNEIYLMNADGSSLRNLTNSTREDGAPSWSPDGAKIAFETWTLHGRYEPHGGIAIVAADGSQIIHLTNSGERNPKWSPDGDHIAYLDHSGDLHVMRPDGTDDRLVWMDEESSGWQTGITIHSFAWSPEGQRIAFSAGSGYLGHIFVVNSDGSCLTQLPGEPASRYPSWSPDGKQIAFASEAEYPSPQIHVMNDDGSGHTWFRRPIDIGWVTWSPDQALRADREIICPDRPSPESSTADSFGRQRFCVSLMATHTDADIDRLPEVTADVWAKCAPAPAGGR